MLRLRTRMEEGHRHHTVRSPPALQGTKARTDTAVVVVGMERSRLLDLRRMIHHTLEEGTLSGLIVVEHMRLLTVILSVLEVDRLLVDGVTEAFRLRKILVDLYVRSLQREG